MTANDCVDELLLAALRIFNLERHNLDAFVALSLLLHQSNCIGLVVLDTDVALLHIHSLHDELQTHEYLLGMLKHETVVGSQVRLALYGIDDDALGLASRRR